MNRRRFLINNSKLALGVSLIPATGFSIYDNARFTKFILLKYSCEQKYVSSILPHPMSPIFFITCFYKSIVKNGIEKKRP